MSAAAKPPAKQRSGRRIWTPEEDALIVSLVGAHGTKKWSLIAQELKAKVNAVPRTGKQCRTRWLNHLDPTINKGP